MSKIMKGFNSELEKFKEKRRDKRTPQKKLEDAYIKEKSKS